MDLNPKSVEICQLRLWIELLKNAYYYKNEQTGEKVLQTLPNIDINIKCGNSLASRYPVTIGKGANLGNDPGRVIWHYKEEVAKYKDCKDKTTKAKITQNLEKIKNVLRNTNELDLFDDNAKLYNEQDVYANSLEWMIEFPEIMTDKGNFEGFDVIIGNPPYISLESLKKESKVYAGMIGREEGTNHRVKVYTTHETRGDIYSLFVERGLQLLKKNGSLSYILPNKWMKVGYGKPLRKLFLKQNLTQVIDFDDNQIFEDATTYTCIIRMTKAKSAGEILSSTIRKVNSETLAEDVEERKKAFQTSELNDGIWIISSREDFEKAEAYKKTMGTLREFLGYDSNYGIKVGLSKAFNVSIETANRLIAENASASEILRPFMQGRGLIPFGKPKTASYLLFIPKGFTAKAFGLNPEDKEDREKMPDEHEAWAWFESRYPSVAHWLLQFKDEATKRTDKGDYWWELRACAYYSEFSQPKLFYQTFQVRPCFIYSDQSVFCNNSMWFITIQNKALLALLCSNMGWWLISKYCPRIQNGYQLIWDNFKQISIPSELPPRLGELADLLMLDVEQNNKEDYATHLREVNEIDDGLYYDAIKGIIIDGVAV